MRIVQSSAALFKLTGGGIQKRSESGEFEDDDMSDFGDGDGDFERHYSYVPYVRLAPKKPPSAVMITGMKQRYHFYPPMTPEKELHKKDDTADGPERTVSFAGALSSSSAMANADGNDPSLDLGTAYLQSLINQMGGSKKTSSDVSTDRKKERFQFDPHASREAGLRRYCDFLHGEGIDHEKLDDFTFSSRIRSNSSLSGGGNSSGSDKKSSLSSTSFRKQ